MKEPTGNDLIEEARTAGQAYIESFKGDHKAMMDDLNRRAEADGRKLVSLPPKRRPVRAAISK